MIRTNNINSYNNKDVFSCNYTPPTICPSCNYSVDAVFVNGYFIPQYKNTCHIYLLLLCKHCKTIFIVKCMGIKDPDEHLIEANRLLDIFPYKTDNATFPKSISNISKNFVKIYNEAYQAENHGLTRICGMGYRKALEFLIKDYLIYKNPQEEETIKGLPLSACINNYLCKNSSTDKIEERIHTLAQKSTWIGNDETHYVRKHNNRDFNDLKLFIDALVSFLDAELILDEAESIKHK